MNCQNGVTIRRGHAADCSMVLKKIVELAVFEKMQDQVKMTTEILLKDGGFLSPNDPKHFELLVAETKIDDRIEMIGYAMWFYAFSSLEGKIGFLEDIYIDERFRRQGIAKRFFNLIAKEVVQNNGAWLKLNMLNTNAQACYDSLGGRDLTVEQGYHIYRFDYAALEKMAKLAEDVSTLQTIRSIKISIF